MPENWIKNAFEQAEKENGERMEQARRICEFLEDNSMVILDEWQSVVGTEAATKFATYVSQDQSIMDSLMEMTKCFCIAGYLLARMEIENQ